LRPARAFPIALLVDTVAVEVALKKTVKNALMPNCLIKMLQFFATGFFCTPPIESYLDKERKKPIKWTVDGC
jgi:hypothetical protein